MQTAHSVAFKWLPVRSTNILQQVVFICTDHTGVPCKNRRTIRDGAWGLIHMGPRKCLKWGGGSRSDEFIRSRQCVKFVMRPFANFLWTYFFICCIIFILLNSDLCSCRIPFQLVIIDKSRSILQQPRRTL